MATESVHVSDVIPASAERIYRAWLDGVEHAAMTGGAATSESHVGGRFSAWDGYIRGTNLALDPGRRIVQAWRSADFPEGSPDSRLEVLLEQDPAGTRVTLIHSEIPEGQASDYEQGWREHYFTPMRLYFTRATTKAPTPAPVAAEVPPPLEPAPLPPIPTVISPMPRPAAIAMPPAEEWEEIETTVMKSPPVELIIPSTPKPSPSPARAAAPMAKPAVQKPAPQKPAAKKPAAVKASPQKAAAKKPAKKAAAKKPIKQAAAKKPAKKAAVAKKPVQKTAAAKKPVKKAVAKKPAKKIAAKKSPAKKPAKKAAKKPAKKGKR